MISLGDIATARLVVGVDTHKDEHVAVAIDQLGVRLGEHRLATSTRGYAGLECWASGHGDVQGFGIEGTGSYGAGLARFLASSGHAVVEVNRPDRSARRRIGKSDPTDAESAARAVLARVAHAAPKSGVDQVEIDPHAEDREELGSQGPDSGHQPNEGADHHSSRRAAANPRRAHQRHSDYTMRGIPARRPRNPNDGCQACPTLLGQALPTSHLGDRRT